MPRFPVTEKFPQAYAIEYPSGERFVVLRLVSGEYLLDFPFAAALHERLGWALERACIPVPFTAVKEKLQ